MKIGEVMARIHALELTYTATKEMLALLTGSFISRDGLPAEEIILTDDGRQVPQELIREALDATMVAYLEELQEDLDKLKNMTVDTKEKIK
ncbi:MAG: hypothetical protein ACO32I_04935 [Candidatus Limnocylindrus sp.]